MKKSRIAILGAALVWSAGMLLSNVSTATMQMQKNAKAAGFPVDGCMYCHVEKMPKKDAATYNDRGKWLQAEKAKRNAKDVDVNWLKEYPGDKK